MPATRLYLACLFACFSACHCGGERGEEQGEDRTPRPAEPPPETTQEERLMERGAEITNQMQSVLSATLVKAIREQGVAQAVQFCSMEAIPLTDSISRVTGARIRRATHKPRNPDNKATSEELEVIRHYLERLEAGQTLHPRLEATGNGHTFYAPIRMASPLCLNCHGVPGKDIKDEDYIAIQMAYPNDSATGFALGDLRGVWRIDLTGDENIVP